MIHVVIGSQWGDEGKGKIIDLLSDKADFILRFHGGNNAGHTVVNKYGKFPLHLVPSGIFSKKAVAVIGNGVVLDLEVLISEIKNLANVFPNLKNRLIISPRCHVIMPYHKILDRLYEEAKGKAKTGTTGRGIGPVYADKVSYHGIRLYDLLNAKLFKEKLTIQLRIKNKIIKALGDKPLDFNSVYRKKLHQIKVIKPYVSETFDLLHKAVISGKYLLYEGAHGIFLDNDWGTYPFVTASSIVSSAITAGSGIPAKNLTRVTGVVKAYTTRVGAGPFPTELLDKEGDLLRDRGGEFGTTTGRPRRCGWFDAVLVKFAAQLNGFTGLAITKLDVLDDFHSLKLCIGYELHGKRVAYADIDAFAIGQVKPVYLEMKGWRQKLTHIRKKADLPFAAKHYLKTIEKYTGVPVRIISVGPAREETILH